MSLLHLADCNASTSLAEWLTALSAFCPQQPRTSLSEVIAVAKRLAINPGPAKVITVAGTNGKGSTVAILEACFLAQGYQVAAYTSPHLQSYTERMRLQGQPVTEAALVNAMTVVKSALKGESLNYFDFSTLVALWLFMQQPQDVWLLEVGLGGRLDAVNIIDADVAVIVSIALDHMAELGGDRETIGREKAGIIRPGFPVVIGDRDPPQSLLSYAKQLESPCFCASDVAEAETFSIRIHDETWDAWGADWHYVGLPKPKLPLANAAVALQTIQCLHVDLPVSEHAIRHALTDLSLAGRMQCLRTAPEIWVDVAHNPAASQYLATQLSSLKPTLQTVAIVGMMADKDIVGTLLPLLSQVDSWCVVDMPSPRAAKARALEDVLHALGVVQVHTYSDFVSAITDGDVQRDADIRVIIFGSFVLVGEAIEKLARAKGI